MAEPSAEELVLYSVEEGVATITLNRPERLNAWTASLERRFFAFIEQATSDHAVRVVVITGAGRGFCAGADVGELGGIDPAAPVKVGGEREAAELLSVPKLIIAAVNGACVGVGLALAAMCDLRFAAAGAKFSTPYARLGLVAENGTSWSLPRLLGTAAALDILVSGRVFLAEEAVQLGLVNRVYPADRVLAEAQTYARDIALNCSPSSIASIKWQVYRHAGSNLRAALTESLMLTDRSLTEPDFQEGMAGFRNRRPPAFGDLTAPGPRDPFSAAGVD